MSSISPPPSDPTPPGSELITLADSIMKDFMVASNIADLNTVIYLLSQPWWSKACLKLLAKARLTRFSYTGKWMDVIIAGAIFKFLVGLLSETSLKDILREPQLDNSNAELDYDAASIVDLAGKILTDFFESANVSNLNTAIFLYSEAISTQNPDTSRIFRPLANAHLIQFLMTGNTTEVRESISLLRRLYMAQPNQVSFLCAALLATSEHTHGLEAIELIQMALESEREALTMAQTGTYLLGVCQQSGDDLNLDTALLALETAVAELTWGHDGQASIICNLGIGLRIRFHARGNSGDLDRAIGLHQEALDLHPAVHSDRGMSIENLADMLLERFQARHHPQDLDSAIHLYHEALDLKFSPDPSHGVSLNKLATALYERFQKSGNTDDLDSAIRARRKALELLPPLHPHRGSTLNSLASELVSRVRTKGDFGDLDDAILLHHDALGLFPPAHTDRWASLNNLANALQERFQAKGDSEDLNYAIKLHNEALDLLPAPHQHRGLILSNLALVLGTRFHMRGDPADLNSAIRLHHEGLDELQADHPDRGNFLNNLAKVLYERFRTRANPEDLDSAVRLNREALELRPAPHPDRSTSLNSLAAMLANRFYLRGAPADLDSAIQVHREALDLQPAPHPSRGISLNNLANVLYQRWEINIDPDDIESAIELHQEALSHRPTPHPDRGNSLDNLAGLLSRRFQVNGDPEDIDKAIQLHQEALDLHPSPHPDRGTSLNNLAFALRERGRPDDFEDAIRLYRQALAMESSPHPDRGKSLANMGRTLLILYDNVLKLYIIEQAVVAFRESSAYLPSPISYRCQSAAEWAQAADIRNHESALEAYEIAIELLPQQAMLGLDIQLRQKALSLRAPTGLASDAAACASRLNEIEKAVEFLEAGRSVFWSQALQLHVSLDDLQAVHPGLAKRILDISQKLEFGSYRDVSIRMLPAVNKEHVKLDQDDAAYRKLNADWVAALGEVRRKPGFQGFLRPKLMNELRAAAIHGPIIILNASSSEFTALIVTLSKDVQSINLEMTWQRAQLLVKLLHTLISGSSVEMSQILTKIQPRDTATEPATSQDRLLGTLENSEGDSPDKVFGWLLAELWILIVEPVFRALELKKTNQSPNRRLWWCPTGPLTFLPIHAAGLYGDNGRDCVSDYVVSSYTPGLASLLDRPLQTGLPFKMTAVIQPVTRNLSPLPATRKELRKIEEKVPSQWLTSLGDATPATVDMALHHLQESSVVHFACHGRQDLQNSLDTGLQLTDGRLKVSELMRGKSRKKNMTLAFLSACETAKGDAQMPDEAMHLAASMLFAGFRGVVGTMWTMADPDGPRIAETFYDHLFKGCNPKADPPVLPDLTKAAEALHVAVAKLRTDPTVSFRRWVPFVHYGL